MTISKDSHQYKLPASFSLFHLVCIILVRKLLQDETSSLESWISAGKNYGARSGTIFVIRFFESISSRWVVISACWAVMSFRRAAMPIRQVSNACSSSRNAFSLSYSNYSLRNIPFALSEPTSTHEFTTLHLRSVSYLFCIAHVYSYIFVPFPLSKFLHGFQALILLAIAIVFLKYISKAGNAFSALGWSGLICLTSSRQFYEAIHCKVTKQLKTEVLMGLKT